jgi:hypothetical protein
MSIGYKISALLLFASLALASEPVPSENLKTTVGTLRDGTYGYIECKEVFVDWDGYCWLNKRTFVTEKPTNKDDVMVFFAKGQYSLALTKQKLNPYYDPNEFEAERRKWIKVDRFKFSAKAID